jgi:hypothetical protein
MTVTSDEESSKAIVVADDIDSHDWPLVFVAMQKPFMSGFVISQDK